jgi:Asp-tRNA(Asn)/Glu-tRNA(Gln) amidotransferase A subunit family amidase
MPADELWRLTATELSSRLRSRACSAVEATRSCLERAEEREPAVKAFVELDRKGALRQAEALDRGAIAGPLHGIPVAIKDTIDVEGLRCSLGTEIHRDRIATRDAGVVRRLRDAGAVILGTTVSTEYAIARAGPTTNPHDASRTPGGSSSGSAAAVAARMAPLAIGTQTVGSIVRPASYCGIFGYKPPKDAVSTEGVMPLSGQLDHVGPLARSVDDLMLAYRVIRQAATEPEPASASPKLALLVTGPFGERIEPPSRLALERAQALLGSSGIPVVTAEMPDIAAQAKRCWETILFRDIALHHGADRDKRGDSMSDRLRKIIDEGRTVTVPAYEAAVNLARQIRAEVLKLIQPGNLVLAPAVDGVAPLYSEFTGASDLQGLWTLTGMPALAVPCGEADGLPIGVQLIARPSEEYFLRSSGPLFEALQRDEP